MVGTKLLPIHARQTLKTGKYLIYYIGETERILKDRVSEHQYFVKYIQKLSMFKP